MLCIKEGDNNTKFFHKMANSRRRYNHISMLEVDGIIYEDDSEMTDQVVQFYKNLYKDTEEWRPFVEGLEFDQIEGLEGTGLKGGLKMRRFFVLLKNWKEIKLQVLMVFLWPSITIVGELWKEMF